MHPRRLVLDGVGARAIPASARAHRVRVDAFAIARASGDQRRIHGVPRARPAPPPPPWWTDPRFDAPEQPVVGVSWFEAVALLRVARPRRMAPPVADGGRVGAARPAAAWRRPGIPGGTSARRRRGSIGRRLRRPTPANASGSTPSPACATSGALDWDERALLRGRRPSDNPPGPAAGDAPHLAAAARGGTTTPGARWRTARPCRRACATPTTASGWCASGLGAAPGPRCAR